MTEYSSAGGQAGSSVQVGHGRRLVMNNVAIAGVSNVSNPFNANTRLIRVHSDTVCSILIGQSPVATTVESRMATNQTEYYQVIPGDSIAVIVNT